MRANLHLHSRFSDGTDWPDSIARRASKAGIEHVALTDHDTLSGAAEFRRACEGLGLKSTIGVEIDCREPSIGYKSELLAYFPGGTFRRTAEFLDGALEERLRMAKYAVKAARKHFFDPKLNFEKLLERKRGGRTDVPETLLSFNKLDVYQYLREAGCVPGDVDYKTFKRTYFDSRILQDGGRGKALCSETVDAVRSDGGVAVVPHIGHEFGDDPGRAEAESDRLRKLLKYFKSIGVDGVELYYYRNGSSDALNRIVRREAKPLGFFFTYGSDCHGAGSGKDTIADFDGNFTGFPGEDKRGKN